MPSFLKRFASIGGKSSGPSQLTKNDPGTSLQQQRQQQQKQPKQPQQDRIDRNDIEYGLSQELVKRNSAICDDSDISSDSRFSKASNSTSTTISSASSLSLALTNIPTSTGPSRQQIPEVFEVRKQQQQLSSVATKKHTESVDCAKEMGLPPSSIPFAPHSSYLNYHQQSPSWGHTRDPSTSSSPSHPRQSSNKTSLRTEMPTVSNQSQVRRADRSSLPPLSALFHPRSRSMPILEDIQATHAADAYRVWQYQSNMLPPVSTQPVSDPGSKRASTNNFGRDIRRASENIIASPMMLLPTPSTSPTLKGKKTRPKSLSSLLLQHEQHQQQGNGEPRLPRQSKANRWANRGGIGMNEMMVDLETTGVFVPSSGQRLRAEFVYRTVIQCADEIRRRGLDHPNIFNNPSPKKVISSMIALLIDQDRCDLYSIQCLRIDTVTGLLLNLLSQMSNPVIPYLVMEHYFRRGGSSTRSPSISAIPTSFRRKSSTITTATTTNPEGVATPSDSSPISTLLPTIPALPSMGPSHVAMKWAREHFDLPAFLDVLPALNRVILLEVLHLCQEILGHQGINRMTLAQLVKQVSPALFSTVFDRKILDTMVGGSMQCSIHGDSMSSEEGSRAENHLFMVILVRFLYLTSSNNPNAATNSIMYSDMYNTCDNNYGAYDNSSILSCPIETNGSDVLANAASDSEGIYGQRNNVTSFRRSQEKLQQGQQAYYDRMERSYQDMEIRKRPSRHFGVYSAAQKQQLQQEQQHYLTQVKGNDQNQDKIVPDLAVSKYTTTHVNTAPTIGDSTMGAILAITEASMMDKRAHYDHLYQVRA